MAVVGTVFSVAQALLAALDSSALRQLGSISAYKADLDDLKNTVESVKSVLLDAEAKEELSCGAHDYVEKLKDAVFDADDLFDEFLTLAERDKQLMDGKLLGKVREFFSSRNSVKVAFSISGDVKKIREKLNKVADDHSKFGFVVDNKPIRKRKSETCSYVHAPDIIGREGDAKAIVEKLLDADCEILTIVGLGGIGKTALAQLVYNDQRVINEFALKFWVCVSDQDGNDFNVKIILCKLLELADHKIDGDPTLERVQTIFREEFKGQKFLLVLDDLWNEDRHQWTELSKFLRVGSHESRCVVTTRSFLTATAIGNECTYPLLGLSNEDSWSLFKITAFAIGPGQVYPPDFIEIGKDIVEKCANVPLAIKVIGSLLYGEDIRRWQSIQQSKLCKISESNTKIMPVLKLSFYNLEPALKSCFSYCAIFPKDEVIDKEKLKLHWMALGYVIPFDEGQSIEDAAEDYFLILLRRCFFQSVRLDENGEIISFVIHDLMHDVAQHVAMNEISSTNNLGDKARHLFSVGWNCTESSFPKIKIRSCYETIRVQSSLVDSLAANWIYIRALTLKLEGVEAPNRLTWRDEMKPTTLPGSIGNLLHLRFLDLSNNGDLEVLPNSVTNLHNLQTLYLRKCWRLKELPKKFSRLVKLRHLHIKDCKLSCMPPGMDKLTNLCKLTSFVVADESSRGVHRVGQLVDLRSLVKLSGSIEITVCENARISARGNDWRGSSPEGAEHLKAVAIKFFNTSNINEQTRAEQDQVVESDEAIIENLQLHPNLCELELSHYSGEKIPVWGISGVNLGNFLPNLVTIKLGYCSQLQKLPLLSKLRYLKHLTLMKLEKLEYMDSVSCNSTNNASGSVLASSSIAELPFFPSLESLELTNLVLKGWWSGVGLADPQPPFHRLSTLIFDNCPQLTSFPPCPRLEFLQLFGVSETLRITTREDHLSLPLHPDTNNTDRKLAVLLYNLHTLPVGRVTTVNLYGDVGMESLSEAEEILKACCSTLRNLTFHECGLRSLTGGLEHLTALESLELEYCGNLSWAEENDMPWRALQQNLHSLKLRYVGKTLPSGIQHLTSLRNLLICGLHGLESLPEWISCLSALQSLHISYCNELKSFPDSMQNLTSLQKLDVVGCPALMETYQDPSGEEARKVQHIPHLSIIDRPPRKSGVKLWKLDL